MAKNKIIIELEGKDSASKIFVRGTKKIDTALDKTTSKAKRSFGKLDGLLGGLSGKMKALAGVAGIGLLTAAVGRATKALFDMYSETTGVIDIVVKTARTLGMAADKLYIYEFAAQRSGVQTQVLHNALKKMVSGIAEAAKGTGLAKRELEWLGVDIEKLAKMSPDKMFLELAKSLATVENEADRLLIATKIFGLRGAGVLNMLKDGPRTLIDLEQKAKQLGFTIGEDFAGKAEEAQDALLDFDLAMRSLKITIVDEFMPPLTALINGSAEFIGHYQKHKEGIGDIIGKVMSALPLFGELIEQFRLFKEVKKFVEAGEEKGPARAGPFPMPIKPTIRPQFYRPTDDPTIKRLNMEVSLYREILTTAVSTEKELETVWEVYREKREEQIKTEIDTLISQYQIGTELASEVTKARLGALDKELETFKKSLEAKESDRKKKEADRLAQQRIDAETKMLESMIELNEDGSVKNLEIWNQYHAARVKQIGAEAEALKELGIDMKLIGQYVESETAKIGENIETKTSEMSENIQGFANDARSSMEDGFFSVMRNGITNLGGLWNNLTARMLDSWLSMISEMMVADIMGGFGDLFSGKQTAPGGGPSPGTSPGFWSGFMGMFKGKQRGGWLNEPVIGFGTKTGTGYTLAEREPEFVTPRSKIPTLMPGGTGPPKIELNMPVYITTPDSGAGFMRSQSQIMSSAQLMMRKATRNL